MRMSQLTQFKNDPRETIVKTIVFFDLFDYPLTAYEIYKYCDGNIALSEIVSILESASHQEKNLISQKNGFYFLSGRENIIVTRQQRYNYARRKIKIAGRFSRLLKLCPFIRLVAVANLIGAHNLRDQSDIDFFIITAPRRLWLSRLYCAGLAKILRLRPTPKNKKDKICLSFYVSADRLNLDDLKLPGFDPYFDYWRRGLVPLYNKGEIYNLFLKKNKLINQSENQGDKDWESRGELNVRPNFFLDFLEKISKKIQLIIMPAVLKAAAGDSDGVVIGDTVLKLYLRDCRREYAEKYGNKINEVIKKND